MERNVLDGSTTTPEVKGCVFCGATPRVKGLLVCAAHIEQARGQFVNFTPEERAGVERELKEFLK